MNTLNISVNNNLLFKVSL